MLLALLILPLRGLARVLAALAAAAGYCALSLWILPPLLRVGYGVTATVPAAVAVAVALAVSLVAGVWVAAAEVDESAG